MDNVLEVFEDSEIVYNKKEEVKMSEVKTSSFIELNKINVNDKVEKKNGLTYLSWAWAWAELKKRYPDAKRTVYEREDGVNYWTDGKTAWVKVGITINDIEEIDYLPIMDFRNKSIPLGTITSFDVNKTIMRSTVKAIGLHGLGLYIYSNEDLPEDDTPNDAPKEPVKKTATQPKKTPAANIKLASDKQIGMVKAKIKEAGGTEAGFLTKNKLAKFEDMTSIQASKSIDELNKFIASKAK